MKSCQLNPINFFGRNKALLSVLASLRNLFFQESEAFILSKPFLLESQIDTFFFPVKTKWLKKEKMLFFLSFF